MNNINLVPIEYEKSFKRKWYVGLGVSAGVIGIVSLMVVAFIPIQQIKMEQEKQAILDQKINREELEIVKAIAEEIKQNQAEKTKAESMVEQINLPSYVTRETMDILVAGAPKGLKMDSLTVGGSEDRIAINGNAEHVTKVVEYIVRLHRTKEFENITYTTNQSGNTELEGWIAYNIDIKLKSLLEEEAIEEAAPSEDADDAGGEEAL